MGPLLPFAILAGGLWYLDKDKPQVGAKERVIAPRYSKMAVAAVTETRDGVRCFKPAELDLSTSSLEHVGVENGPGDIAMFKLLSHIEYGSIPADKAIEQAVGKGLCVLASLSVVLAAPGTQPMLLMFCSVKDAAKYANANSHFAVLARPIPAASSVEVVEEETPKPKRNGLKKIAPEPPLAETSELKAEA